VLVKPVLELMQCWFNGCTQS